MRKLNKNLYFEKEDLIMDDMKITNIEEVEVEENYEYEEPERSGNGIFGKLVLATLVASGTALVLRKTKGKREKRKIEKLRKKGYYICEPEINDDVHDVDDCVMVESDETE